MANDIQKAVETAKTIEMPPSPPSNTDRDKEQADVGNFSISAMNDEWALILLGSKAAMVHEQPHVHEIEDRLQIRTVDAFNRWYDNKFVMWRSADGKLKPMTWAKVWIHAEGRRQYRGLEFLPDPNNVSGSPGYLNLWRGFECEPVQKRKGYEVFKDHMLTNVCDGDQALYNWGVWLVCTHVSKAA